MYRAGHEETHSNTTPSTVDCRSSWLHEKVAGPNMRELILLPPIEIAYDVGSCGNYRKQKFGDLILHVLISQHDPGSGADCDLAMTFKADGMILTVRSWS